MSQNQKLTVQRYKDIQGNETPIEQKITSQRILNRIKKSSERQTKTEEHLLDVQDSDPEEKLLKPKEASEIKTCQFQTFLTLFW